MKSKILALLDQHRLMTIATNRPDGWPTIDHDVSDPMAITGLSMAAEARRVYGSTEEAKAMNLLGMRYPEYAAFPMPKPEEILVFRLEPKVISVLDYSKGFGHSDLVTIEPGGER